MSENISSNVLFHFTKSLDSIVNILTSGFYPHYCPEYLFGPSYTADALTNTPPSHAAPMVCFCDLPLSLIKKHLSEYGQFGIGLEKQWGINNGVAPVFYTHDLAQTYIPISQRIWAARDQNDSKAKNDLEMLMAYTKPFHGNAWRNGKSQLDVPFYNEREWRYVPRLEVGEELFLSRKDYLNDVKRNALHASFKQKYNLGIHSDDIQYLIVPDDRHILELVEHLRKLYDEENATLVTTAIMTTDCIHEDV
jgi:hypothetical protein